MDKIDAPSALSRDDGTVLLYAGMGLLGYLLNGLGSVLAPLQQELHVDRAQVAFYPSLFAAALLVVGLAGGPVVRRAGHRRSLVAASGGLAAGAALLSAPGRGLTLAGAVLLGCGGALMVQVVPAALTDRHPAAAPAAIGEANAVASAASVAAPASPSPASPSPAPGLEPGPLPGRWADLLLAVSVEFCLVFWAASAFSEWHGAGGAAASAYVSVLLLGMAVVRAAATRLVAGRHPLSVIVTGCLVAGAGFGVFWGSPVTAGCVLGLFVTGAGIGLLYPMTLARVVAAWPHARDHASARAALASGLAIGVAPLALAALADRTGLRAAYLIVPALLVTLAVHASLARAADPRTRRRHE
jgi:fucose permease